MSYLAIDEIRGKTSGTPTDVNDLKYQLATAWVNFNGTGTVSIRDSYNVSSITDRGTGLYTVNFAGPMDNINYSVSGSVQTGGVAVMGIDGPSGGPISLNTSGALIYTRTEAASVFDFPVVTVAIHGGKT